MADLNKVMLIGRLTRDPQLKYLPSQTAVCEFGLAVGRKFKTASGEQKEETAFIDCTLFGKGGEIFNQYMGKGRQVFIEGRLKYDTWEDKNGGGKRSRLTVNVEEFQFLDSGNREGGGGGGGGQRGNYGNQGGGGYDNEGGGPPPARPMNRGPARPQQQPPQQAPYGEEQQFNDDDIPF